VARDPLAQSLAGAGIALCGAYGAMLVVMYLLTRGLFAVGFEWGRLAQLVAILAAVAVGGELLLPSAGMEGLVLRCAWLALVPAALLGTRFFHPHELAQARRLAVQARRYRHEPKVRVGEVGMRIVRMRRESRLSIVRLVLMTLAAVASGVSSLLAHSVAAAPAYPLSASSTVVAESASSVTFRVYATREGLVGGTTSSGHVITTNDHFVALPSVKALNKSVKISYKGKSAAAPVLDIGPWNNGDGRVS